VFLVASPRCCHDERLQSCITPNAITVFLIYHHDDYKAAEAFVRDHGHLFEHTYTRGVTEGDDFVGSPSDDTIIRSIRDRYIHDASLAIVLLGAATWGRRFVDWEIAAALGTQEDEPLALMALDVDGRMQSRMPPRLRGATHASAGHSSVIYVSLPASSQDVHASAQEAIHNRPRRQSTPATLLRTDLRSAGEMAAKAAPSQEV